MVALLSLCVLLAAPQSPIFVPSWSKQPPAKKHHRPAGSAAQAAKVLFALSPEPGRAGVQYEMVETCGADRCRLAVRLRELDRISGEVPLGMVAPRGPARQVYADEMWGVEDGTSPGRPPVRGWMFGLGEKSVTVAGRPVLLAPRLQGLLVHLAAHGQPQRRRHYLFVAIGGRLRLAWDLDEGVASALTTVAVGENQATGRQQLLLYRKLTSGERTVVSTTTLAWNERTSELGRVQ